MARSTHHSASAVNSPPRSRHYQEVWPRWCQPEWGDGAGRAVGRWTSCRFRRGPAHGERRLDTSFNGTGSQSVQVSANGGNGNDQAFAVDVAPDNDIILAGVVGSGLTGASFGVVALGSDGKLDSAFGSAGIQVAAFPFDPSTADKTTDTTAYGEALTPDGKLAVGGIMAPDQGGLGSITPQFAIARLLLTAQSPTPTPSPSPTPTPTPSPTPTPTPTPHLPRQTRHATRTILAMKPKRSAYGEPVVLTVTVKSVSRHPGDVSIGDVILFDGARVLTKMQLQGGTAVFQSRACRGVKIA